MKYTIVIPSYLGPYASAAKNRDEKLIRAVNSCLVQTFNDFEIIVVSDGCQKTMEIVSNIQDTRFRSFRIERQSLFTGGPRNKGIEEARGEYIIYLDIDDVYGPKHLEVINSGVNGFDWVWFDDIRYNPRVDKWYENRCDINVIGRHGTSNICHKQSLNVRWDHKGYAHDYYFVRKLFEYTNFKKIASPEYYVAHVPGTRQSGGYDL